MIRDEYSSAEIRAILKRYGMAARGPYHVTEEGRRARREVVLRVFRHFNEAGAKAKQAK